MPTFATMLLPPPESWQEFEKITLDALKIRWQSPDLSRHGRSGQSQAGVDIYGHDDLGRHVGVQCKLTSSEVRDNLESDVRKAEEFTPPLDVFFFATASPTDAEIQRSVRMLSEERLRQRTFPVGIYFWQDLILDLARDPQALRLHYPQLSVPSLLHPSPETRPLALMTIGFYGLSVDFFVDLIFGEAGRMAQEDPQQFVILTRTIQDCATAAAPAQLRDRILRHLEVITGRALEAYETPDDTGQLWRRVDSLAAEIEAYVANIEYGLRGKDLWAFRVGGLLGRWNRLSVEQDELPSSLRDNLLTALEGLFDRRPPRKILDLITHFDPERTASLYAPQRLFALTKDAIRYSRTRAEGE